MTYIILLSVQIAKFLIKKWDGRHNTQLLSSGFTEGFTEGIEKVRETCIEYLEINPLHFFFHPQIVDPTTALFILIFYGTSRKPEIQHRNFTLIHTDTKARYNLGATPLTSSTKANSILFRIRYEYRQSAKLIITYTVKWKTIRKP